MSQIIITMENGRTLIEIDSDDKLDIQYPNRTSDDLKDEQPLIARPKPHPSSWFRSFSGFNKRLYKTRRNALITQQSLANSLGISQSAVGEWESGRSHPKRERIETIAEILDTTPEYLLTGEENEDTIS
jgi:DNA-binding XRE family transcriptional regulator